MPLNTNHQTNMQKLFTEFNPTNATEWEKQLVKDLKGIDFSELFWKTSNLFEVKPFYTYEDLPKGIAPVFTHHDWDIGEAVHVIDEHTANQQALGALNGGASYLRFCLNGHHNLSIILKDILIEHIAIEFVLNNDIDAFLHQLDELILSRHLSKPLLKIAINHDALAQLAENGYYLNGKEAVFKSFKEIVCSANNSIKPVIDVALYQNAGANPVTELSLILSHYNEYLTYLNNSPVGLNCLNNGIQLSVSVGSDFFTQIAKLRALRKLLAFMHQIYEVNIPVFISCVTSHLSLTSKDAYTNLLRSATQAMSAVMGGCNALCITPFDALNTSSNTAFSWRMARNQQLILKEECYLNKSADLGAGSYYIESLTEQLASHAFQQFKDWEMEGGFMACLEKGLIQQKIRQQAKELQHNISSGNYVLTGVNQYTNPADDYTPKPTPQKQSITSLFEPIKAIRLAQPFETGSTSLTK